MRIVVGVAPGPALEPVQAGHAVARCGGCLQLQEERACERVWASELARDPEIHQAVSCVFRLLCGAAVAASPLFFAFT